MTLGFFFFKQKTAYEMRISDWSSDVCSAQLAQAGGDGAEARAGRVDRRARGTGEAGRKPGTPAHPAEARPGRAARRLWSRHRAGCAPDDAEIGRASCRERVCQDV